MPPPPIVGLRVVDAGGNVDRHNMRVFLLTTYSVAGGLPLGVLITTNEQSATTISRALDLYLTLLDESCFFRRGLAGPAVFMKCHKTPTLVRGTFVLVLPFVTRFTVFLK